MEEYTPLKWKVDMLKEYVIENIIIMNLTETWLKEEQRPSR